MSTEEQEETNPNVEQLKKQFNQIMFGMDPTLAEEPKEEPTKADTPAENTEPSVAKPTGEKPKADPPKEPAESKEADDDLDLNEKPEPEPESKDEEKPGTLKITSAEITKKPKAKKPAASEQEQDKIKADAKKASDDPFSTKKEEAKKEAPDYSQFSKSERDVLEVTSFGEDKGKFDKGTAERIAQYYKDRKVFIQKLQEENLDDDDYDYRSDSKYRSWAKRNDPKVDTEAIVEAREERMLERAEERAVERMRKELKQRDGKVDEIQSELRQSQIRPRVEAELRTFSDTVLKQAPKEVLEAISKADKWETVEAEYPIEAESIKKVLSRYEGLAESYLNQITKSGPTEGMAEVRKIVQNFTQAFAKQPSDITTKNGKAFTAPWNWGKIPEQERGEWWTWQANDVLKILRNRAKKEMNTLIETEKQRAQRYQRYFPEPSQKKESQPPEGEQKEKGSTTVKSSPASTPSKEPSSAASQFMSVLGMRDD